MLYGNLKNSIWVSLDEKFNISRVPPTNQTKAFKYPKISTSKAPPIPQRKHPKSINLKENS
jgi:hypothetical protein